jgi:hypothetical protein
MSPVYKYKNKILTVDNKIAVNEACCCGGDACIAGLRISDRYSVSLSSIGCDSSWFNGLSVIVSGPSDHLPNNFRYFSGNLPPEDPEQPLGPWRTVTAPLLSGGFISIMYYSFVSLVVYDYIDENNKPKRSLVEANVFNIPSAGSVTYQTINFGAICEATTVNLWTTECGQITETYDSCTQVQSTEPTEVPSLHAVVDYVDTPTVLPGINAFFIHRFSGDESGSCQTGYLLKFDISS